MLSEVKGLLLLMNPFLMKLCPPSSPFSVSFTSCLPLLHMGFLAETQTQIAHVKLIRDRTLLFILLSRSLCVFSLWVLAFSILFHCSPHHNQTDCQQKVLWSLVCQDFLCMVQICVVMDPQGFCRWWLIKSLEVLRFFEHPKWSVFVQPCVCTKQTLCLLSKKSGPRSKFI